MKVLLVSSSGGHLDELVELADRFTPTRAERVWLTPSTPHARSLLSGEEVVAAPQIGARQAARAVRAFPSAWRYLSQLKPDLVLTTGAALAVPYVLAARSQGVPVTFIDSATRLAGPSLTGRMLRWVPGVTMHYQSTGWSGPWRSTPTLFHGFHPRDRHPRAIRRIVVILGTERFPFSRAVGAVLEAAPEGARITWQLGHTPAAEALPGDAHDFIPFDTLVQLVEEADVVVTHAGVGSILTALRAGARPVVIAREGRRGEHVDDHQGQLARSLAPSGVVLVAGEGSLDGAFTTAAGSCVVRD